MACVIGVDVGSQSVKAVVTDEAGTSLATASAPCTMSLPASGWAEQDPEHWRRALTLAVRQARARAGVGREDVVMLGLACQVDGLVALDERLHPLRPAIIWLDRRATRQADALREAVGEAALVARTGLNPDASHTAPKAMWLRDTEPEHYRAARWLAPVGAHLNGWLTGEVVQDHANASSTLLYDLGLRGLEGCAFALRDIVDRFAALDLAGEEIRVVGGGARSPLWLRIKADVTGRPVRPVLGDCATSTGAAMLAGVAAGCFAGLAEAADACVSPAPDPVVPDPAVASVYEQAYQGYRALFDGVEGALA